MGQADRCACDLNQVLDIQYNKNNNNLKCENHKIGILKKNKNTTKQNKKTPQNNYYVQLDVFL